MTTSRTALEAEIASVEATIRTIDVQIANEQDRLAQIICRLVAEKDRIQEYKWKLDDRLTWLVDEEWERDAA